MKLFMFSVFDRAAGFYERPYSALNEAAARRSFVTLLNDPALVIHYAHPEDFDLYCVGSFDDDKGLVSVSEASDTPVLFGRSVLEARKAQS